MNLSADEVRYVAGLANLELSEEEISRMRDNLDEILTHIEKLNELDTTGVEPMAQVLHAGQLASTWREDEEREPLGSDLALANAPLSGSGYFKVPRVLER